MSFLKLTRVWVPGVALLVGCTSKQSTPSAKPSESDFIAAFRQAHEQRDLEAMSKLVCWDRVTPEMRKLSEGSLKTAFDDKIADIKLTTKHPKGRPDVYVRNGVTYGFNLLVIAELIVDNAPRPNETFSTYDYPLGVKEGHYCIAQAAPVEGLEAQEPLPPPSLADQATQPLQPGKTSGGAQPVVVPAKTFLIIRLGGDIGLKTVKSGGNFSATVAEPVVVGGVTVIPAGSSAQGIVAKEGDYGPDVTLTSLTVNGKSYKISTGYVTFNQEVVFPARSEMKFEFVLPLKLND